VIQLSKFLKHTLATHNQVDSFFENINHNDGKGAFTLTLFEMTITDCPGFHVPHCILYVYIINLHLGGNGSVNAPLAFSTEKLLAVDK
jgi:hypothetical protein